VRGFAPFGVTCRRPASIVNGMIEGHRGRRAFTLVEVLVVVSVLAVLLALLMPALAGARSQARDMVCRSNLRQLVLANVGYAAENDGFYVPAAKDMWDNAGRQRWHGVRESLAEPFDPAKGPLVGYLADGRIKECPAGRSLTTSSDWNGSFEKGCGGYGYNMMYLGSRLWDGVTGDAEAFQQAYARTARVNDVARPGQTLMFADTAMANNATTLIEYSFAEPPFAVLAGQVMTDFRMSPSIHFRHRGYANVGWADGHVGSHPMGQLNATNAYGIDASALNLGWFEPMDNSPFDLK
jgi:prepilin-type N-terminal cleavage/methylation domain-containing protein/prepilin-type processing-associated H-X9-DG protein